MFYWLLKRKIDRTFKDNKRLRGFRSFDSMECILILFDYKDIEEVGVIAQDLRNNGKQVLMWTLREEETPASHTPIRGVKAMVKNDLSKWNVLAPDTKNEFKWLRYDTLFNFAKLKHGEEKYDALSYLLASNRAEFCVGIEQPEVYRIFDFVLLRGENQTLVESYEQIKLFTIKNIRNR